VPSVNDVKDYRLIQKDGYFIIQKGVDIPESSRNETTEKKYSIDLFFPQET
jgi:hypothetical protein